MILDRGQMVVNAHTLYEGTQSVDFVIKKACGDKQHAPDAIIHRWSTLSIFAME